MDDWDQREDLFRDLIEALWDGNEDDNGTFAAGHYITPDEQSTSLNLQSFHVEGVGELRLPLSLEDFGKLLGVCEQAPYGHGEATIINPEVRRAWQVDGSKVTFPQCPDFISDTVRLFADGAVDELGLDGEALQLEVQLYKLLLYEADGHFCVHRDTEREPGMFATLVLQLPTEGGFEGGALHVSHGGATKTFDFSLDSATTAAYTVFYADCEHELQRITNGKRLCLAFNLVRRNHADFDLQPGELQKFLSRLASVEEALIPWKEAVMREAPDTRGDIFDSDKLAITLQHKYTEKNLSFPGLKGVDRMAAHVLRNCRDDTDQPWLDVHLCILSMYKSGSARPVRSYKRRRRYLDSEGDEADARLDGCHRIDDDFGEKVISRNWIDVNNRRYNLGLEIDPLREVVHNNEFYDGPFDEYGQGPDVVKYETYMGNYGSTMEYEYHTAMLVIWPKKKLISIACNGGVPGALDILEARAEAGDPDIVMMLHEVLSYCESHIEEIWHEYRFRGPYGDKDNDYDFVSARLLKLCLVVGGFEDVVRVLELISKPHTSESKVKVIGIRNVATATAIASVVEKYGWVRCGALVMEMLKEDRVKDDGKCFAPLAVELQKLGCESAALLVAQWTLKLIYFPCQNLGEMKAERVWNLGKMIFCIKGCMDDMGNEFHRRLEELKRDVLFRLIVQIHSEATPIFLKSYSRSDIPEEAVQQALSRQAALFRRVCMHVIMKDFHHPDGAQAHIVDLVLTIFKFGDEQLFDDIIEAFLAQSRVQKEQRLLKKLLDSDAIWTHLSGTVMGRSKLELLAEERIQVLGQPGPPFSWHMPFAKFGADREVEAFLKGRHESYTYSDEYVYDSHSYANNFAKKYFDGSYVNGYSALGEVAKEQVRSRSEYCVKIKKTRTAFECDRAYWKEKQVAELSRLRNWLGKLNSQAATTATNVPRSGDERAEVLVAQVIAAM
ncbi:hypothetical protein M758_3G187200 [Ceratodon purpureus]|nr:hypothetical protein M758_3G187200 [Ceratodon purpureus]